MIVSEVKQDILSSSLQTLTVPVNTIGAMGRGLALDFRNKYEGLYEAYRRACQEEVFKRKGLFVFDTGNELGQKILCFPTKEHWRFRSKLDWIIFGLDTLANEYKEYGITELAVPALGCGLGSLNWNDVYNVIHAYLGPSDLPVTIHLPQ